jgi:DtxR family transcriptional regulator, Mn-dependent transcriptional regulator
VTSTTENYLKAIITTAEGRDSDLVGLGELAKTLALTPGTITTMVRGLRDAGFVEYMPRTGVRLTERGKREALSVLRRHRLIELFLVQVLGLDWSDVHQEAEELEHAMSDRLLERIDEVLGHPTEDPHGDPIPRPGADLPELAGTNLSEVEAPAHLRITRVEHEESSFLDYLKETGLTPGNDIFLSERNEAAGTLTLQRAGSETTISIRAAAKIRTVKTSD